MITTGKEAFLAFQLHCGVSAAKVGTLLDVQSSQHVFIFFFFLSNYRLWGIIIGNSEVKGGGVKYFSDGYTEVFIYFFPPLAVFHSTDSYPTF